MAKAKRMRKLPRRYKNYLVHIKQDVTREAEIVVEARTPAEAKAIAEGMPIAIWRNDITATWPTKVKLAKR
jgi:hypothetical protein